MRVNFKIIQIKFRVQSLGKFHPEPEALNHGI